MTLYDIILSHIQFSSFLLRLLVQTVLHMEEGVLREYVAADFGAALTVEGVGDVGELTEDVEAVEHEDEVALHGGVRQAGVPYEVIGVECGVVVAPAREHGEVGG